jgi:hypothetical protein
MFHLSLATLTGRGVGSEALHFLKIDFEKSHYGEKFYLFKENNPCFFTISRVYGNIYRIKPY